MSVRHEHSLAPERALQSLEALTTALDPEGESASLALAFLQQAAALVGAPASALWLRAGETYMLLAAWPMETDQRISEQRDADLVVRAGALSTPVSIGQQYAMPVHVKGEVAAVIVLDSPATPADDDTTRWLVALGRFVATFALTARESRRRTQRHELLLNLATLPDLAFEAGPEVQPAPSDVADVDHEDTSSGGLVGLKGSFQYLAEVISLALDVQTVGFLLFDPDEARLVPFGHAGRAPVHTGAAVGFPLPEPDAVPDITSNVPDPLVRVFHDGRLYHADAAHAKDKEQELLTHFQARALVAAPLSVEGDSRGVLFVASAESLDKQDVAFLVVLAARVSLLLERAELTQLQRRVQRQHAQAAARQEFLGIITHELKTPVAVIRAYTELLIGRAQKSRREEERDLLERIDDQAQRMLTLVDQILDLQRLDTGLFPLELSRIDLAALAERIAEGLQLTAGDVRLRVTAETQTRVRADRRRVEQVITNLLQNAIRFAPPGTDVQIVIRESPALPSFVQEIIEEDRSGPWVLISVSDQGSGVSDADRARIFNRFYQGQGGEKLHRGHGGLGVGLYIAREIVSRHGGSLWLEPQPSNGKGATFTVALQAVS